jgi:hypothetical protein
MLSSIKGHRPSVVALLPHLLYALCSFHSAPSAEFQMPKVTFRWCLTYWICLLVVVSGGCIDLDRSSRLPQIKL